jgi:hypothetical protein
MGVRLLRPSIERRADAGSASSLSNDDRARRLSRGRSYGRRAAAPPHGREATLASFKSPLGSSEQLVEDPWPGQPHVQALTRVRPARICRLAFTDKYSNDRDVVSAE